MRTRLFDPAHLRAGLRALSCQSRDSHQALEISRSLASLPSAVSSQAEVLVLQFCVEVKKGGRKGSL